MSTARPRDERGTVAIEVVAMVPLLVLVALFTLQVGAAGWAASQTQEAARQSARAQSLGRDPVAAAEAALPAGLHVDRVDVSGDTVTVVVKVPRVAPMPTFTVEREVAMAAAP